MLLKILEINGVKYLTSCTVSSSHLLTFYCHNENEPQTFTESFPYQEFQQRLMRLNPRVKFPENAVKETLLEKNSAQATMAAGPDAAGVWVLALKYMMIGTTVPLKWEWNLKPMDSVDFYRYLLVDAIDVGHELHVVIKTLTKDLCAKDKELEQYRREGCQLRRTTVRTKTFDLLEFEEDNKDLFEEATAYNEINDVFSEVPGSSSGEVSSTSTTPSTTSSSSWNASGRPTSSSASSNTSEKPTSSSSNTPERISSRSAIAARNRKRKAEAMTISRLEEKIKQRVLNPEVKFNSQSSQEDEMVDWLVERSNARKKKQESASGSKTVPQPVPSPTIKIETEAPKVPKAEVVEVKTEKAEEPEESTTIAEENNNETLTESDQELKELRAILAVSMAQKRERQPQK
ncbi:uncharacterized protein LOC110181533 isoform X1 [Drosophila serrata]|uniref:uncharacterized protein LOC110181533 isoform X1 n=1 Tax=Drosophila serrata TaxID=7274 RepID=UPI000A1D2EB5|nr:uncharacterized protein LOC110181533 isoform X1 [Drosophila serrata]KAH8364918.1 hypothetical protein KR200_003925 [Drosophila serrata]